MEKVRWGVLGTADIAQTQVIPAMLRSENSEVTAIASGSGRAKEAASAFSIPYFFDSYQELLESQSIDAVYIPLPNHLHETMDNRSSKKR